MIKEPNLNQFVKHETYRVVMFGKIEEMVLWDAEIAYDKGIPYYMLSFNRVFAWFDLDLVSCDKSLRVLL